MSSVLDKKIFIKIDLSIVDLLPPDQVILFEKSLIQLSRLTDKDGKYLWCYYYE